MKVMNTVNFFSHPSSDAVDFLYAELFSLNASLAECRTKQGFAEISAKKNVLSNAVAKHQGEQSEEAPALDALKSKLQKFDTDFEGKQAEIESISARAAATCK